MNLKKCLMLIIPLASIIAANSVGTNVTEDKNSNIGTQNNFDFDKLEFNEIYEDILRQRIFAFYEALLNKQTKATQIKILLKDLLFLTEIIKRRGNSSILIFHYELTKLLEKNFFSLGFCKEEIPNLSVKKKLPSSPQSTKNTTYKINSAFIQSIPDKDLFHMTKKLFKNKKQFETMFFNIEERTKKVYPGIVGLSIVQRFDLLKEISVPVPKEVAIEKAFADENLGLELIQQQKETDNYVEQKIASFIPKFEYDTSEEHQILNEAQLIFDKIYKPRRQNPVEISVPKEKNLSKYAKRDKLEEYDFKKFSQNISSITKKLSEKK